MRIRSSKSLGALISVTVLTGLALTGCSTPSTEPTTPADTATTSNVAPATDLPRQDVECVDGKATFSENGVEASLSGSCDTVEVTASNAIINIGSTEHLVVSGSINLVRADSVGSVQFTADGNIVQTPSSPQVDDQGQGNEISH